MLYHPPTFWVDCLVGIGVPNPSVTKRAYVDRSTMWRSEYRTRSGARSALE